jgi:hypothetical protein
MAWKKASVELLVNYAKYRGFAATFEHLGVLKWKGYQHWLTCLPIPKTNSEAWKELQHDRPSQRSVGRFRQGHQD